MDVNQIQQITDRISQNLASKGVSPDKNSIFEKLLAYINDFGVVPFEAERKVLSDQYKKYNIPEEQKPAVSFTPANEVKNLADIMEGEWVTVEVKIVSLTQPRSAAIAQSGIMADSTGALEFVTFAKATDLPVLETEKWYRIESAIVDSFRGARNLKLHSGTKVTELTDERCLVPASPTPLTEIGLGVVPCIRAKFVDEWEISSDKMSQTGLLADENGRTKFTIWKSSGKESLNLGSVYTIYYPVASEFNGRISIALDTAIWIEEEGDSMPAVSVRTKMAVPAEDMPVTPLHSLKPGYATVHVKFIEAWENRSEKMLQCGLVGDESDRMKFVIWKDGIAEPLELNKVYTIKKAKVDEYNGRLSLALNRAEIIGEEGSLEVGNTLDVLEGNLVQIAKGSGLIKRCPVEGCGRVLSKQNLCPVHEIQPNGIYDMRIRGVLDTGEKAYTILMNRETTEVLSGMTLEKAKEIGTSNPLGSDEVQIQLSEQLCGRYLICKGTWFNDLFTVREAAFKVFDPSEIASLMNRAGANLGGDL
ncbi:MAG TPA: hypothetical protein O0X27_02465 [Methanocorpusculum sp.]|nr:hypothetical protein [Methanocorpusculum sp.]